MTLTETRKYPSTLNENHILFDLFGHFFCSRFSPFFLSHWISFASKLFQNYNESYNFSVNEKASVSFIPNSSEYPIYFCMEYFFFNIFTLVYIQYGQPILFPALASTSSYTNIHSHIDLIYSLKWHTVNIKDKSYRIFFS